MAEGKQIPIEVVTTSDTSGLQEASKKVGEFHGRMEEGAAGADMLEEAMARLDASVAAAIQRIDGLDESAASLAPGLEDVAKKADQAEKAIAEAKEAVEEHGVKSEKATQKMLAMGQISQGLSMGLNNLAEVARSNGQEELANDLNKVAAAMSLVTSIAATGLQFQTAIAAAGGLRAAITGLRASAAAALVTFGPYIAAIAAGAAAYYALTSSIEKSMQAMDAQNEQSATAIGRLSVSHEEEKSARQAATQAIEDYRAALAAANDELERNLELAGNEEQLKKAKINAEIREKQSEIDAQSALFRRTGGAQGMNPEDQLKAEQRLREERIQRLSVAEETRRKREESALEKERNERENALLSNQTVKQQNDMAIDVSMGSNNLSVDERKALRDKAKEVEQARQKYGADSDEVAELMKQYTDIAVKMNEEEKNDLLNRLTLREELSKKIEEDKKQLEDVQKRLDKTLRKNNQERSISEVEAEAEVSTTRTQTETKIADVRAQRLAQQKKEREDREERNLREKLPGMESALDRTAAENRDQLLSTDQARNGPRARELQSIAKQIGEADTTEEIRAIAERFKNMSGGTVELIRGMLAAQERQAKEIQNLKSRLNKL